MEVGSLIVDFEFPEDKGIILAHDEEKGVYVLCFNNGCTNWLPRDYIEKCKVLNESR